MKYSSSFIITVLFFNYLSAVISCKNNSTNAGIPVNTLYYFPEKNIYYDSLQSKYYYSLDSARTWDSMSFNAAGYGKALGPKVPIERTGNSIWTDNDLHRQEYNGVLLNIVNNYTIGLSRSDSISKIKPVVAIKNKQVVIEKEPPPKKGLKKFFNKIFKKKKKTDKEKNQ